MIVFGRPGWALAATLLLSCRAEPSSAPPTVESVIAAAGGSNPRETRAVLLGTVACVSVRRCADLITTLAGKPMPKMPDILLEARLELLLAEVDGQTLAGVRLSGADGSELRAELEKLEVVVGSTWVVESEVETSPDSVVVSSSAVVAKTFAATPPAPFDTRPDATLVAHVDSSKLGRAQRERLVSDARAAGDAAEASELSTQSFRQVMRSEQWISYLESNASIDASLRHAGTTLSFDATITPESGSPLQLDYQRASEATSRSASIVPYASAFSGSLVLPIPLDDLERSEAQGFLQEVRQILPIAIAQAPAAYRPVLIEDGAALVDALDDDFAHSSHIDVDLAANLVVDDAATLSAAVTGFAKSGYPQVVRLTDALARAFPQPGVTVLEPPVRDYDVALFDLDLAAILPPVAPYFGKHPRAALGASHEMLWFTLGTDPLAAMDRLHKRAKDTSAKTSDASLRLHFNLIEAMSADPNANVEAFDGSLIVDLQSKNHPTHNATTGTLSISGRDFIRGFFSGIRNSYRR